jgi:tetratricopeptide (TPR) repeat protein
MTERLPVKGVGWFAVVAVLVLSSACRREAILSNPGSSPGSSPPSTMAERPSILLITLDTTRADAIGPAAIGVQTPAFNALAARGRLFRQAYATVPETLPSHSSMMTGLYPAGHGVHENARFLAATYPTIAERLQKAGYRTSAFVSSFALARRFGLARGFDVYDDDFQEARSERTAKETSDLAISELLQATNQTRFMWVHFYDPHSPYTPPEPFKSQYPKNPYLGEVASMDEQIGRLVRAFEQRAKSPIAVLVVADHGEGLGDHGESQHGYLAYQPTMHVPLMVMGPGVGAGVSDAPVSTRHVFHTLLDWANLGSADSLRGPQSEIVLGEAMKPFLEYGWQPQVMAVAGGRKAILAGKLEVYDVASDPSESRNLGSGVSLAPDFRKKLEEYPIPSPEGARAPDTLDDDARRRLASLGYVSASAAPVVRKDAPRPADMTHLFQALDKASGLFASGDYAAAIPLLEKIRAADPYNLDALLRLATAHSSLGHDALALGAFRKAGELAPRSIDVRTYLALHYARGRDWALAAPLLEQVVAESPERLPALEALAVVRERQGRVPEAIALRQSVYKLRPASAADLTQLGQLAMSAQQTGAAIEAFEGSRALAPRTFTRDLELGVLYLDARRLPDAAAALDRVSPGSRDYPMALFKRAQVSVLLNEPDRAARIDAARRRADATTRGLIERERLFQAGR